MFATRATAQAGPALARLSHKRGARCAEHRGERPRGAGCTDEEGEGSEGRCPVRAVTGEARIVMGARGAGRPPPPAGNQSPRLKEGLTEAASQTRLPARTRIPWSRRLAAREGAHAQSAHSGPEAQRPARPAQRSRPEPGRRAGGSR